MQLFLKITTIILCFSSIILNAQYQFPDPGFVFEDSSLVKINITLDEADLTTLLATANQYENIEYLANFSFERNGIIETVDSVGFRLRGNTSRKANKKSFKVSFNTFKSQKFHDLEKLNLNGEHNDPSITRAKLSWDLMRLAGIPGSRSNHVMLYINNEYFGVYLNVEHIDEHFLKKRFSDDNGNLYKCLYPSYLDFTGTDQDQYKEGNGSRRTYDLKTNKQHDDYTDFVYFIQKINTSSDQLFECELESIFDIDSYLRLMAMDVLTSNWDGQSNTNNFYLYNNPCNNKFTFIPYDLDNTFGIDWSNTDWPNSDIYNWMDFSWQDFDFWNRVMGVKSYRDRFSYYINSFMEDFFHYGYFDNYLKSKQALISDARAMDVFSNLDYGWNHADFENSFYNGVGQHARFGIMDYMVKRRQSAKSQIELNSIPPSIIDLKQDTKDNQITIAFSLSQEAVTNTIVNLQYRFDQSEFTSTALTPSLDGSYVFETNFNNEDKFEYLILLEDDNGESNFPKCNSYVLLLKPNKEIKLRINEIMSSNSNTATDNFDEYDDWVEIYNAGPEPYLLNKYYLTDDPNKPYKWRFPRKSLNPGDYLIIWLDNDTDQGNNHADFKLKSEGEFIGIFEAKSKGGFAVDSISTTSLMADQSYGRLPNGSGFFQTLPYHTHGYNNEAPSALNETGLKYSVYPNPSQGIVYIETEIGTAEVSVFDANGNKILEESRAFEIDLTNRAQGVYFLKITIQSSTYFHKLIIY